MKFLVDAQLPRRLVLLLQQAGEDAIHTLDLPHGNRTPDAEINTVAEHEQRVVITKDADFVNSFLVQGQPSQLLLISTGNITNAELLTLNGHRWRTLAERHSQHKALGKVWLLA